MLTHNTRQFKLRHLRLAKDGKELASPLSMRLSLDEECAVWIGAGAPQAFKEGGEGCPDVLWGCCFWVGDGVQRRGFEDALGLAVGFERFTASP